LEQRKLPRQLAIKAISTHAVWADEDATIKMSISTKPSHAWYSQRSSGCSDMPM
jgi:hypothetical protein